MRNILKSLFYANPGEKAHPAAAAFNLLLVCGLITVIFWLSLAAINVVFDFSFVVTFRTRLWSGFVVTLEMSVLSMLISLAIGVLSALGRGSRILAIRYLCDIYVSFIRGTPLIMQIYLFFYIIGTAWGVTNRLIAGALILSIFEGAYIAEIIRGSMLSIDDSQLESARAVGLTRFQTARYVIIPQLVARTLPALTGQFASIIKDSSLLSMISVIELTQTIREISASNFRLFECYIFLGLLYLCLTLPITFVSKRMERRFDYAS
jgi:polar amino acid transport system permease protein